MKTAHAEFVNDISTKPALYRFISIGFIYLFIYLFICLYIYLFIYLFIYIFIYLFISANGIVDID